MNSALPYIGALIQSNTTYRGISGIGLTVFDPTPLFDQIFASQPSETGAYEIKDDENSTTRNYSPQIKSHFDLGDK